jgi:hypothetical protein
MGVAAVVGLVAWGAPARPVTTKRHGLEPELHRDDEANRIQLLRGYGVQLLPSTQRRGPPETKSGQQAAAPASGKARAQSAAQGQAVHGVAGA